MWAAGLGASFWEAATILRKNRATVREKMNPAHNINPILDDVLYFCMLRKTGVVSKEKKNCSE
jgi:hypothetical protein